MKHPRTWIPLLVFVFLGIMLVLSTAQSNRPVPLTLEDIYDLLVAADGTNRLDAIEEKLDDLDLEVDLIYQRELALIDAEARRSEDTTWTLSDIRFLLNAIETKIDAIKAKTDALP